MNRRASLVLGGLVLLLGGVAWLRWLSQGPQGTDQQQIVAQIQRGERAAEERSIGALMRVVSPDYKDDIGLTRPALRYQAGGQLREAEQVEVTIPSNQLQIRVEPGGQEATSSAPVEVRITDRKGGTRTMTPNLTLRWRKERVRRYLLFPVEEWRVVRAEGVGGVITE
jgi:hypothetical protein